MSAYFSHLECPECHETFDAGCLQTICTACQSPLLARYDLGRLASDVNRDELVERQAGPTHWAELLPLDDPDRAATLGEGSTPLIVARRSAELLGMQHVYIKEEGVNPTGTFKARGLAMAVSKAVELGVSAFVIPTAGNAGGALAAYAARAGAEAHIFMPADAPQLNQLEVRAHGADLRLVDGLIDEAGRQAAEAAQANGWFNVSTFREPYRVEGKKVMGLELAEAFGWELPDVIIYPTGGGTGLVGMWKAFEELEGLGWIDAKRPRMVSVQASGCAPVVRAVEQGAERTEPWPDAHTIAAGLRVPAVFADRLILRAIQESHGTAVAVDDAAILQAQADLARDEGVLACPEGAATLAGLRTLREQGWIKASHSVVLFNTGSGLKYMS
jgi:threonine synthase